MADLQALMRRFVMALNSIDEAYYADVANLKVNKSELWLMYVLDDNEAHSQKEICEKWGFPKTTLNTAIKQAEAAGYVTLSPILGKRREMNIALTDKGKAHAHELLGHVYRVENEALEKTLEKYSIDFIEAIEFFAQNMKSSFYHHAKDRKK